MCFEIDFIFNQSKGKLAINQSSISSIKTSILEGSYRFSLHALELSLLWDAGFLLGRKEYSFENLGESFSEDLLVSNALARTIFFYVSTLSFLPVSSFFGPRGSFEESRFYGSLISFGQCSSIYHFLPNLAHISHDALLEQVRVVTDSAGVSKLILSFLNPGVGDLDSLDPSNGRGITLLGPLTSMLFHLALRDFDLACRSMFSDLPHLRNISEFLLFLPLDHSRDNKLLFGGLPDWAQSNGYRTLFDLLTSDVVHAFPARAVCSPSTWRVSPSFFRVTRCYLFRV